MGTKHTQEIDSFNYLGVSLEVVNEFGYLGDLISNGEEYSESVVDRIKTGVRKFRKILPLVSNFGRRPAISGEGISRLDQPQCSNCSYSIEKDGKQS